VNNLSVQGSLTGVSSNASGKIGNAYTFDGSTGYLRQKTYLSNIGTLSFQASPPSPMTAKLLRATRLHPAMPRT
jgi:hypothetical protein